MNFVCGLFVFFVLHKNFKHNICIFCRHLKCKFSRDSCNASHIFRNASNLMERKKFDALSLLSQFIYAVLIVAITFTLSGFQRVLLFVLGFSIAFALFLNFSPILHCISTFYLHVGIYRNAIRCCCW